MSSSAAEAPGPASEPSGALMLAGLRTKRPDILNRFKKYRGGWDITNKHYWAFVGFTGAAALILAIIWFVFFGLAMITHHYSGWRIDIKGVNICTACIGGGGVYSELDSHNESPRIAAADVNVQCTSDSVPPRAK